MERSTLTDSPKEVEPGGILGQIVEAAKEVEQGASTEAGQEIPGAETEQEKVESVDKKGVSLVVGHTFHFSI